MLFVIVAPIPCGHAVMYCGIIPRCKNMNIQKDLALFVQLVVKPVVQPVWQPVVSCKRGLWGWRASNISLREPCVWVKFKTIFCFRTSMFTFIMQLLFFSEIHSCTKYAYVRRLQEEWQFVDNRIRYQGKALKRYEAIHAVKWRHISVVEMWSAFCRSTRRTVCIVKWWRFVVLFE